MPSLYRRGSVWHYAFTAGGRRYRRSAHTPLKDDAAALAAADETRVRRSLRDGPASVLSFADAVGLYLETHPDAQYLLKLLDHFEKVLARDITAGMLRDAARTNPVQPQPAPEAKLLKG